MKSICARNNFSHYFDISFKFLKFKLQGKGQNICQYYSSIEGFWKKLKIFKNTLENNNITYFSSCQEIKIN